MKLKNFDEIAQAILDLKNLKEIQSAITSDQWAMELHAAYHTIKLSNDKWWGLSRELLKPTILIAVELRITQITDMLTEEHGITIEDEPNEAC